MTGYDALDAFAHSYVWESFHDGRSRLIAQVMNIYDFSLGLGFVLVFVAAYYFSGLFKTSDKLTEPQVLSLIGLIAIVILNFTNLANWEAARVWLLLQPLVVVPASIALIGWGERAVYFGVTILFLQMNAIASTMILLNA